MLPSHRVRPETGKPGACAWLSLDRLAGRLLLAGHAGVGFAHRLERGAHGIHEHLEHLGHGGELCRIRRRRRVADAVGEVLDRTSDVSGKSVSVRVILVGRSIIKKTKSMTNQ